MNRKAVVEKLIAELHLMLPRPILWIGETNVNATQIYLRGMRLALEAMGIRSSSDTHIQAIESRGWEFSAIGAVADMQKHNLSEEQMVQELLLIEIKMLEIVAAGLEA